MKSDVIVFKAVNTLNTKLAANNVRLQITHTDKDEHQVIVWIDFYKDDKQMFSNKFRFSYKCCWR